MKLISKSKKHCENVEENYFQHMRVAQRISFELFTASIMAFIHSLIPALFQKNASKKIISLHDYLEKKMRIKNED